MNWIKLHDWKQVEFPTTCPYNGEKTDSRKEHHVDNTSIFWIVLRVLGIGEYITLHVPYNSESLSDLKKKRMKAIWRGLGIGAIFAILGFVVGVWVMVESNDPHSMMYRLGMMLGGIVFLSSLILGPFIGVSRVKQKYSPLFFRKNGKELWVKVRSVSYRKSFVDINEENIKEDLSTNEQVLDQ